MISVDNVVTVSEPPKFEPLGEVYIISWEKERIKAEVSNIDEHNHTTSGEVLFSFNDQYLYIYIETLHSLSFIVFYGS